jgi:hypothetical protein
MIGHIAGLCLSFMPLRWKQRGQIGGWGGVMNGWVGGCGWYGWADGMGGVGMDGWVGGDGCGWVGMGGDAWGCVKWVGRRFGDVIWTWVRHWFGMVPARFGHVCAI